MRSCIRSRIDRRRLVFCIIALMLVAVLPAVVVAQGPPPAPDDNDDDLPPPPPGYIAPTPTPSPTPDSNLPPPPPGNGGSGGNGSTPPPDPTITDYELYIAMAPNRIVLHAATPAQLIRVEEGLQYYFIGRDGSTRIGPWIPPFAELKARYPSGDEVSLYNGPNPFTGKRVKIDYLPAVNRVRVDTFYADREHDKNKAYIFHFGPEHDITYDHW